MVRARYRAPHYSAGVPPSRVARRSALLRSAGSTGRHPSETALTLRSAAPLRYKRGARAFKGEAKQKYRKGACKNCGAMTHKATECMDRPRKIGAWKTGEDIKKDEVVQAQFNFTCVTLTLNLTLTLTLTLTQTRTLTQPGL